MIQGYRKYARKVSRYQRPDFYDVSFISPTYRHSHKILTTQQVVPQRFSTVGKPS